LAGKYRVERVLGHGGMGVVVAARHLDLGELYAIKFLLPQALESSHAVDRFLREARASARLKGEHVAKVHDVGRLGTGAPYMVLEFLAGSDLHELVRKRGPLPIEEAATYVIQACEAIAEAHALGIVHRDIKPANLFLIQRPNGTPCVKVLDFGISKQVSPEGLDLTKTGTVLGSPLYMSPEQMSRTKHADTRSDVWSMGVVLYKLVTGAVPFSGETLMEVIAGVLQNDPAPPSRLRPELPQEVDAIVARCLQKQPEHRFQSIHELATALQPLAGRASAWPDAGAWSQGRAVPQGGRASSPEGAPVRGPQPEIAPAGVAQPNIAPGASLQPGAAEVPGSPTGSTWGRTAGASISSKGSGKVLVAAGLALGVAALGGAGAWFARRPPSEEGAAPQAAEVAPAAAADVGSPAAREPSEPSVTAAPPAVVEAPREAAPAPAPEASAKDAQAGSSRSVKSKGSASGGSAGASPTSTPTPTPAPTQSASPVAKPSTTSEVSQPPPPPPTAPSARPKPKHEGVF